MGEAERAGAEAAESSGGGLFDLVSLFAGEVNPDRARFFYVLLEAFLLQTLRPDSSREDCAGHASREQGARSRDGGQQPSSGLASLRQRLGASLSLVDGEAAPETGLVEACSVRLLLHATGTFFLWQSLCVHSNPC